MEDERIVELFWQRDEDAVTQTERKYGAYCYAVAFNVLSVREDAEECVSDAYRRAWDSIPPERPKLLRAWLGKVTRNLALNLWNKNHTQKRYSGFEQLFGELEDCVPASGNVERSVDSAELGRVISEWLREQSELDRVLFVRRYWQGEALNALADEWGVSQNKLAQKMLRLRRSLRSALEREGVEI